MKITQLVNESITLHESIAKTIPRGLNSQQEIFNFGYRLAVKKLGLQEASKLDTKFALKLLSSYYRQHLDEGLGSAIGWGAGKLAKGVGAVAGGLAGMWDAAKKGWSAGRSTVSAAADDDAAPAGGAGGAAPTQQSAAPAGGAGGAAPTQQSAAPTQQSAAPAGNPKLDAILKDVGALDDASKKELLAQLQGKPAEKPAAEPAAPEKPAAAPAGGTTPPAAGGYDPAKAKADRDAKIAADAAERDQQIAATKQANAAAAQADNDLVAAVKAAKAKPGFQQTAQDRLTIQQGAAKGIHESKKKKKVVAEFNSKFLRMKI